jgi:hypothetical protein
MNSLKQYLIGKKKIPVEIPHHSPYLSGYNEAIQDFLSDLPQLEKELMEETGKYVQENIEKKSFNQEWMFAHLKIFIHNFFN